ncbi:hypothetical protein [Halomicrobium katesii]|uniref:hypothetical protein n=1 Tax=Halomicrobium katesii TaxID=437163 RepID=UPI0012BA5A3B|nr:hypothetical protein [Halomicrobium katesii]
MKTAGCSVFGIASVASPSSASRGRQSNNSKNYEIKNLLRSGNKEEAYDLCDEIGVIYTHNTTKFSSKELVQEANNTDGSAAVDGVSTQKRWGDPDNDPDSEMTVSAVALGGDDESGYQYVIFNWDLADAAGADCHGPLDGAAISFSEDIYRLRKDQTKTKGNTLVETVPHVHGVYAKLQTGRMAPTYSGSGWMETEIDTRDDELGAETNIYGELIHTWDPFCSPSNIGISWSLPGPGEFDVSISGSGQDWKAKTFTTHTAEP